MSGVGRAGILDVIAPVVASVAPDGPVPSAARPEPATLSHRERRIIIMTMMMPVFMGSIDQSILASSLPTIGRVFGNLHEICKLRSTIPADAAFRPLKAGNSSHRRPCSGNCCSA